MRNKRQTLWEPPRGIRLVRFHARPSPYGVQWRVDGQRKTKTFPTVERQLAFAKALAADARKGGTAAFRLDEAEARQWRAFRATVGEEADLSAVAACWLKHRPKASVRLKLSEAVRLYTEAKRAQGVGEKSVGHFKPIFDRLLASLGDVDISAVTDADLARFMAEQAQASDETRRTRFARVRSLFNWLVESKRLEASPLAGQRPPRVAPVEAEILTVEQARPPGDN